jgi:hypothetical protein
MHADVPQNWDVPQNMDAPSAYHAPQFANVATSFNSAVDFNANRTLTWRRSDGVLFEVDRGWLFVSRSNGASIIATPIGDESQMQIVNNHLRTNNLLTVDIGQLLAWARGGPEPGRIQPNEPGQEEEITRIIKPEWYVNYAKAVEDITNAVTDGVWARGWEGHINNQARPNTRAQYPTAFANTGDWSHLPAFNRILSDRTNTATQHGFANDALYAAFPFTAEYFNKITNPVQNYFWLDSGMGHAGLFHRNIDGEIMIGQGIFPRWQNISHAQTRGHEEGRVFGMESPASSYMAEIRSGEPRGRAVFDYSPSLGRINTLNRGVADTIRRFHWHDDSLIREAYEEDFYPVLGVEYDDVMRVKKAHEFARRHGTAQQRQTFMNAIGLGNDAGINNLSRLSELFEGAFDPNLIQFQRENNARQFRQIIIRVNEWAIRHGIEPMQLIVTGRVPTVEIIQDKIVYISEIVTQVAADERIPKEECLELCMMVEELCCLALEMGQMQIAQQNNEYFAQHGINGFGIGRDMDKLPNKFKEDHELAAKKLATL